MNTGQELLYKELQLAAKLGKRAPFNDCVKGGSSVFAALAKKGLISIEVYDKNWRTVEITETHARTMECPHAKRPYKVISSSSFVSKTGKRIPSKEEREAAALAVTKF